MGYSIVFETKIVKLPDGRIIHFDRSGCNNDNAGRNKNEFTAKIYTVPDFMQYAEKFKINSLPIKDGGPFDMKIGSRQVSCYDYGEHLLRMLKRAPDWETFIKTYWFRATRVKGFEVSKPVQKFMSCEEFHEKFYEMLNSREGFSYQRIVEHFSNLNEIVKYIDAGKCLEFYINKK